MPFHFSSFPLPVLPALFNFFNWSYSLCRAPAPAGWKGAGADPPTTSPWRRSAPSDIFCDPLASPCCPATAPSPLVKYTSATWSVLQQQWPWSAWRRWCSGGCSSSRSRRRADESESCCKVNWDAAAQSRSRRPRLSPGLLCTHTVASHIPVAFLRRRSTHTLNRRCCTCRPRRAGALRPAPPAAPQNAISHGQHRCPIPFI